MEGLRLWLETEGDGSGFQRALARLRQRNQTLALVEDVSRQLEALYARQGTLPKTELRHQKAQLFQALQDDYLALSATWEQPGPFGENPTGLNNANLALFSQYNQHVPAFRQLLRDHAGDFSDFYKAVETLADQSQDIRQRRLSDLGQRFHEDL